MKKKSKLPADAIKVRVSCDGRGELGDLVFDKYSNKLLSGGRLFDPAIVLWVMNCYIKQDELFGNFQYKGRTYRFKMLDLEASLKKSK